MTAYLVQNRPRVPQFRHPRRAKPTGCILVHTAENTPDWVGPDSGAENVARFIQGRSDYGSYHKLCDSDSTINLVPLDAEAYGDGTGSNPWIYHLSAATQAAKWMQATKRWRRNCIREMAAAAADISDYHKKHYGQAIPARRVTKAQSDAGRSGFLGHGERDPGRRSDPGASFPWKLFFRFYRELTQPKQTPNITGFFASPGRAKKRMYARRIIRHGSPEAKKFAERWLKRDRRLVSVRKARAAAAANLKKQENK